MLWRVGKLHGLMDPPKKSATRSRFEGDPFLHHLAGEREGPIFESDTQMNQELSKRGKYRFLAGLNATLTLGTAEIPCEAVDLHRGGVMVEGTFCVEKYTEAGISLSSTSEDLGFEGHGRVTHASVDEQTGRTQLGIQFESLDADQTENLELLIARIVEGRNPAPLAHLSRDASIEEIRDALSKIPAVHKITLAKRAQLHERNFLCHDDNKEVIEALCRNPQLTLPEVVQLLQIPELLPTTLELVSRDSRWNSNEEIKITIATHPRVTFQVADRLVRTLSLVAIRKVIRRPGLNPAVKTRLVESVSRKELQGW